MVIFAVAHLSGTDRSQLLLLLEAVDYYVGPDNPIRFIEAFVDGLDLRAAGFVRVAAKETAVADRGYFKIEDIEACEKAGITAFVPKPIRGPAVARGSSPRRNSATTLRLMSIPARRIRCCDGATTANPVRT
ncbi:hypothetical protein [Neorhizobium galegae]|uniref:hypothetical protein n=1 Tax=Neorhizobium galegae TaxID=399 RepID=UPI0021066143|nr:hypothetical protein [Neorhizobium galegae]MCQ1837363.1 hypothetical protein [Neorhizobium galegae]UIY29284.1 hypothetical protein LZK73_22625 [Neorhizobium galegae]